MLRTGLTLVSLALLVAAAACGDDASNVNYPPFPPNTPAPDGGNPPPPGPDADTGPMDPVINELLVNDVGAEGDDNFIEVYGDADTDYSAYTLLSIEGDDGQSGIGVIDGVFPIGTTNATGHYANTPGDEDLDQGSSTWILVEGFSGTLGDDLDDNDDGTLNASLPWSAVVDAVALDDEDDPDVIYTTVPGATVPVIIHDGAGTDADGGWARIPDGTDTDAAGDWLPHRRDPTETPAAGQAAHTPGAPNTEGS